MNQLFCQAEPDTPQALGPNHEAPTSHSARDIPASTARHIRSAIQAQPARLNEHVTQQPIARNQ